METNICTQTKYLTRNTHNLLFLQNIKYLENILVMDTFSWLRIFGKFSIENNWEYFVIDSFVILIQDERHLVNHEVTNIRYGPGMKRKVSRMEITWWYRPTTQEEHLEKDRQMDRQIFNYRSELTQWERGREKRRWRSK